MPTEAQWEYACRAGTTTAYFFGDDPKDHGDYAWYKDNSGRHTHPVGEKKPNPWGLYDMGGNVWQWCQDWDFAPYPSKDVIDPLGAENLEYTMNGSRDNAFRGGSWYDDAAACRSASRNFLAQDSCYTMFGFRVCLRLD